MKLSFEIRINYKIIIKYYGIFKIMIYGNINFYKLRCFNIYTRILRIFV
jgi:hypothetical protein